MSNENLKFFFHKMNESEEMVEKVGAVETAEEVQEIAKDYGVVLTIEEIMTAKDLLTKRANGELSETDLEEVAGGVIIIDPVFRRPVPEGGVIIGPGGGPRAW